MDRGEWSLTADLARLELDETEAERLSREAERMRALFERMSRADVSGLEPTTHALLSKDRVRPDVVEAFDAAERLLEASPEREDDFFLIPNVL